MLNLRKSSTLLSVLGFLSLTVSAQASVITPLAGSITGTVVVDLNTNAVLAFDVRALALVDVGVPSIGLAFFNDEGAAAPNSLLSAFNALITQSGVVSFDAANGAFFGGHFLVPTTGTPNGVVSDAALLELLNPLVFDFLITNGTPITDTIIGFDLEISSISTQAVPEPGSLGLFAGGIGFLGLLALRRSSK